MGLQRIIFNTFYLTSTEAMSRSEDRCVKIGVVFHTLYFENEVGDPQYFCISDVGNSLSDCCQKKSVLQKFFARTSLRNKGVNDTLYA